MLTKIVVEKTYWVGMTLEQKEALIKFVRDFEQSDIKGLSHGFERDSIAAMDDLRTSLLNM